MISMFLGAVFGGLLVLAVTSIYASFKETFQAFKIRGFSNILDGFSVWIAKLLKCMGEETTNIVVELIPSIAQWSPVIGAGIGILIYLLSVSGGDLDESHDKYIALQRIRERG